MMREVAHALATVEDPSPELVSAAVDLAAEALRVAAEALAEPEEHALPATVTVVMPCAPQDVLICAERTAAILMQVMQLVLTVEPQLYALPDELLYAEPSRLDEESATARAAVLKRQAATALRSIGGELTSGVSPWLLAKVSDLRHVEVRKEQ